MSPTSISAALAVLLLLPLGSSAAESPQAPATLPPTSAARLAPEDDPGRSESTPAAGLERRATGTPGIVQPIPAPGPAQSPRTPSSAGSGVAPGKRVGIVRPVTPLRAPETPSAPSQTTAAPISRTVMVSEDGASTIPLSSTALNRLLFPDPIVSAYMATEAVDIILEARTAIVSFRTAHPADVLIVTQGGQFLLRLVPETLPAQTVRIRHPKPESRVTSSYQTHLADLIQAGYRRTPPEGFRTEQPNRSLPRTGALAWYLTLQHRGHRLTIQEYAVANTGAVAHPADPVTIARLFPNARAISADPEALPPGSWARVFVVVDTDSLEPPEPSK